MATRSGLVAGGRRAAGRRHQSPWYALAILLIAYSLSFADRMIMSLMIAPIKRDLAISDFQVSLLIGFAFATFYVIMGLPFGYLADRSSRRNLIAAGVLAWSLATGLCGMATGFASLFLARMALGAGEAVLAPAAYSLLSDAFPRERLGRAISVYVIGNPLGTGLALLLGGSLIATITRLPVIDLPLLGPTASWRLVFLLLALPGIVLSIVIFLTVAEPARKADGPESRDARSWTEGVAFVLSHGPAFFFQLGGTALLSAKVYGTMAWIPAFLGRSHGMMPAAIGLYYGLILATCGIAGLVWGGFQGDRLLRRGDTAAYPRIMMWAAIGGIIPSVAAPLVADASWALALIALSVLIAGMTTGVSAAAIQLVTPSHLRGQVAAIYVLTASIAGIGLGPTAVAALTDYVFGSEQALRYSLAVIAAITLPGAALMLRLGLPHYRRCVEEREGGPTSNSPDGKHAR